MGGSYRWASWDRVSSGWARRREAVSCNFSGSRARRPWSSNRRMDSTWVMAASTALSRLAASQFTRRFTLPRRSFSSLAFITSMADRGAPMEVSRSSMRSLCLK